MLQNIFIISLTMSIIIILLLLTSHIISKRYSTKWKYYVWLIIAVRLIIPYKIEFSKAPLVLPVTDKTVVLRMNAEQSFQIMDDRDKNKNINNPNSADYAPIITVNELIFLVWKIGCILFLVYHILSLIIFKIRIKKHCTYLKMYNNIPILQCESIVSPMMIGLIKPKILLPPNDYKVEEEQLILKHEKTHFKRKDILYKFILIMANAVHWFNPIVYLMVHTANKDLEYSCDEIVLKNADLEERKRYSNIVLKTMNRDTK